MLENFGSGGGIKKKRRNDAVFRPQSFRHTLGCILGSHNRLPLYIGRSPPSAPCFYTSSKINTMSIIIIGPPLRQFHAPPFKITVSKYLQNHKFRPIFASKRSNPAHFHQKKRIFVDFAVVPLHAVPKTPCEATFTPFRGIFFHGFY